MRQTSFDYLDLNSADMTSLEKYLKNIYYDPSHPASFAGPQKLYKVVKSEGKHDIGMHRIRKFLHNQESYSLNKPVRRRFTRNHVISAGQDDLWMADLIDMVKFEKWNKGYRYILLIIDTFSKYIWMRVLKRKTGEDVAEAFQDIFKTLRKTPAKLVTDKGQEFRAKKVQDVMKKNGIVFQPSQNETKASISERAILTIKTKLSRYFMYKDNYTYLPILQDVAHSYNNTYHRTIGMTPASVNTNNEEEVRLATYFAQNKTGLKPKTNKQFKYKIGDHVRITYLRNLFTRAYDQTYSGEVFVIFKRYFRATIPVYRLQDLNKDEIKGTFYQSELQKIDFDPDQSFKVEKILKTRGKGHKKQHLVKWLFYPSSFNAWVFAKDLK